MSYDIRLIDPITKSVIELEEPHELRGGTYAIGGTNEAWLNITYNYSKHFYRLLGEDGIRSIYGMTGKDSIPVLLNAINQLKDDVSPDYWEPTEGNARQALINLYALAVMCPNGVWTGD